MTSERPIPVSRPRWPRLTIALTATVVVVVILTGLTLWMLDRSDSCAEGVGRFEGSGICVGVTDGSYHFRFDDRPGSHPELETVQELIRKANTEVDQDGAWASIAYLLPLPFGDRGGMATRNVINQLYGAYAAQIQANEGDDGEGTPKVRLLVVSSGPDGVAWQQVADELIERREAERIAVVAGLGQSLDTTESIARRLSKHGIPMVGSTITADNLNGHAISHLYRVAPTNRDEVAVGLHYLRGITTTAADETKINDTFLIAAGDPNDDYVVELEKAFGEAFGESFATRTFNPNAVGHTETVKRFAADICNQRAPVTVYYAGRADSLRNLISGLGLQCDSRSRVTILTGDAASDLVGQNSAELEVALTGGRVRLLYTGLAHPEQWGTPTAGAAGGSGAVLAALTETLVAKGVTPRLQDGNTMMAHDAVTVSVAAIRRIGAAVSDTADLGSLDNGFNAITKGDPVCGASGPIGLATRPEVTFGNTINKPIPVIELMPDGSAKFLELRYPADSLPTVQDQETVAAEPADWAGTCGAQAVPPT